MADLIELEQWDVGIYQLETEDPVLGGPDGIDNLQAKQLANRTKYLKAQVLLRALIDSPAFTGNPTAPTPALGDNDASIATTAFVQAAIAALIDTSPAALDTLNELAAALGNDADFATTITNALALKAPLNNPVLTGDPKAPTPALGDNDTSIATTAFVQAAIAALLNTGDYKASVRVASTAAINLAAPGANIDGVAMLAGDRFLEKDNATLANRGIYIWNGAAVAATRALDADTGAEFNGGAIIPVEEGTVNADTNWQITNDGVVTIGVTGLIFSNIVPVTSSVMPGAIEYYAMSSAPTGFLKANGAAISRATYSALFSAIGTAFGVGDGVTTFNIPDLRGEFIRGWDDARGIDGARAFGSAQLGTVHSFDAGSSISSVGDRVAGTGIGGAGQASLGLDYEPSSAGYPLALSGAGGGSSSPLANTAEVGYGIMRPRNIALLACIKY